MRTLQSSHAAQIVGSQPPPGSPPSPAGVIEVPENGWVAQALFVAGRPHGMPHQHRCVGVRSGADPRARIGILLPAGQGCVRQAARHARRRPARREQSGQVAGFSEAAAWSRVSKSSSRSWMPASSKIRRAGPGGQMMRSARSSRPSTARARASTLTPLESSKVTSQRSRTNAPDFRGSPRRASRSAGEPCRDPSLRAGARRAPLRGAPGQRPAQAVDAS
jgi:hypothetical protein